MKVVVVPFLSLISLAHGLPSRFGIAESNVLVAAAEPDAQSSAPMQ